MQVIGMGKTLDEWIKEKEKEVEELEHQPTQHLPEHRCVFLQLCNVDKETGKGQLRCVFLSPEEWRAVRRTYLEKYCLSNYKMCPIYARYIALQQTQNSKNLQ